MQLITNWQDFPPSQRGGVLCIGNFDGVHLGHAKMLSTGCQQAKLRKQSFSIMTFDPHPAVVLRPGVPRFPLTTREQRIELLARFSPDVLLVVPATREFLAIKADEFLQDVVAGGIAGATAPARGFGATLMVEGPSFTYGQGARGTVDTLRTAGPSLGIQTLIVPTQEAILRDLSVINVSSTVIRWLITHGRVADATRALGRPYTLRGHVVEGAKRGPQLGFPTANLVTSQLIPLAGVYAGTATVDGVTHQAAISVGTNPTFDGTQTTVEAFLLDFSGDLYGKVMDLSLLRWVREMATFGGVGPLVTQMHRDVEWTRRQLAVELATY